MKVKVDIECTPAEARAFLGLPDVAGMQEAVTTKIQEKMMATLDAVDPETLFKMWMPQAMSGWENLQKTFWAQMTGQDSAGKKD